MEIPTEVTTASIEDSLGDIIHGEEEIAEEVVDEIVDEIPDEESEEEQEEVEDDDLDDPEGPAVEGDDESVEVEFEGQLIEAPKAIAEALMRNKDYTEKTQELASQRKEVEIQSGNLKRVNEQYEFARNVQDDIIKANQSDQQIEAYKTYMRDNIDTLTHTDIEKIRIAIDDATQERDKIINDVTTRNTEFQQAQEQTLKELQDKSTEVLRQKVPGWGEKHETDIKAYALSLGIPEASYNSVVDPVEKQILYKAMQYDALKSGAKPAVKAVKSAPSIKTKARTSNASKKNDAKVRKQLKSKNLTAKQKAKVLEADIANSLFS